MLHRCTFVAIILSAGNLATMQSQTYSKSSCVCKSHCANCTRVHMVAMTWGCRRKSCTNLLFRELDAGNKNEIGRQWRSFLMMYAAFMPCLTQVTDCLQGASFRHVYDSVRISCTICWGDFDRTCVLKPVHLLTICVGLQAMDARSSRPKDVQEQMA